MLWKASVSDDHGTDLKNSWVTAWVFESLVCMLLIRGRDNFNDPPPKKKKKKKKMYYF